MSKAAFWQRGEALDYTNTGTKTIEANTIISFGGHIGIAGTDILPGEVGSLHVTGVFEMPKTDAAAIEMGTEVYFDGEGITATKGDSAIPAGYAVQAAAAADTVILVKLGG
ncbi:DUF2190 family protein [Hominisplanchenecus murintestinalis]|uniref:DUF2190 family protein n=1 Tax=Hominisplanchenecus murintestinalis TaxID=2941517 RepID=A0AC61QXH6_9FIRM|nr:DUF2190 family protein [Hominisplanchenecus murintestinalis]TGX97709.1 DUF2190 family protein [Hominisplanchenecus murintestinalis]